MERQIRLNNGATITVKPISAFVFQTAARNLKKEGMPVLGPARDDLDTTIEFSAETCLLLISEFKDASGKDVLVGDRKMQREVLNTFDGLRDVIMETAKAVAKETQEDLQVAKGK